MKPNHLSVEEARAIIDAYNKTTAKARDEITATYRTAREYYAKSISDVVDGVAPEHTAEVARYARRNLLSWPVAG